MWVFNVFWSQWTDHELRNKSFLYIILILPATSFVHALLWIWCLCSSSPLHFLCISFAFPLLLCDLGDAMCFSFGMLWLARVSLCRRPQGKDSCCWCASFLRHVGLPATKVKSKVEHLGTSQKSWKGLWQITAAQWLHDFTGHFKHFVCHLSHLPH